MSEQDADRDATHEDDAPAGDRDDGEHGAVDASDEPGEESLDEIAAEPEGDVDELLATIVDGSDEVDDDTAPEIDVDPTDVTVEEELLAAVREAPATATAGTIATLQARIAELESELEATREEASDLESRLRRKQADFQNYKKRQKRRMEEEKQRATEDLVERLLDVRDNLARALDQDEDVDIRSGVESTLDQFDQQLDRENVSRIEPAVGEETDPKRHEVLATVESDQPEGTVAHVHRLGYTMAEKVLRPAQVAVSDGSNYDPEADGTNEEGASTDASETDGDDVEESGSGEETGAEDSDEEAETGGSEASGDETESDSNSGE